MRIIDYNESIGKGSGMDRRKEPRVVYGAWVQLVSVELDKPHFFRAINLSMGGILLRAPTSGWVVVDPATKHLDAAMPDVGRRVEIRLVIENERHVVDVSGEVVYHAGDRFGVRFLDLGPSQRAFIQGLVDELPEADDDRPPSVLSTTKPH
jgi:hypothetical protein